MCGIAGFLDTSSNRTNDQLFSVADAMNRTLVHRGPDAGDIWVDAATGIALAHRRLSIIDLSSAGAQPMHSACGRYVLIYNGEIYNAGEIRTDLKKHSVIFMGHSDTEVLLEACARYGVKETVKRAVGMFSFALWDRRDRVLYLVRDRLGKKPLYWGNVSDLLLFGSELKALRAHSGWKPEINRDALAGYMRLNYVAAPYTIYEGIYKLPPATILTVASGREPAMETYWSMKDVVTSGLANRNHHNETDLISETESMLEEAVSCRMVSDVPLGAFLSGGLDSSTVVALMQKNSGRRIRTFSIGFSEDQFNEAVYAGKVAEHLGTDHTEFYVSPDDALSVIPQLPEIFDEPFSDSSQIPTYLVSRETRQHVTVALSGDGGDEVFAGYNRYLYADKLMRRLNMLPDVVNHLLARIICSVPPDRWSRLTGYLPRRMKIPALGDKLYKLAEVIDRDSSVNYRKLVSHWYQPEDLVIGSREPPGILMDDKFVSGVDSTNEKMQLLDTVTYLPDDILTKVDRTTMSVSLEARAPFLDHRLIEHAWKLPLDMKVRNGQGKWVLRQILYRHVPRELVERPKTGFAMPIADWLRGPLRDWVETLLDKNKIHEQGYLKYAPVKQKWDEHLSGQRNWQYDLWDVLMFQAWLERWMK